MLKRKVLPYKKTLDGGWGWMVVLHFFLVIYFLLPHCLKESFLGKGSEQPNKITHETLDIDIEWKGDTRPGTANETAS